VDEEQLNYLLRTGYIPSDRGFQIGQFGPNQNYLGKGMQGLESLGIGPNLNYLGDGTITGSIGVGPNQNYLGKGMNLGSMGQPRYDSGIQTIFPSNMSPALSDLGGITPSYGVANEPDEEQVEYLTEQEPSGIAKLFEFLGNIPTPFNLARRGLESLRGLNQKIRNTDFGQSRTGAEYFMKRRERKQAERAQQAMPNVYRSARDQGFTNDRGGFSTSRADRAGTSLGSGQFNSKRSTGRQGY
jgi:hypothetical protein